MWKLRSAIAPYWIPALLAPLCMILEVCMDLSQPRLMAEIVNHGVTGGNLAVVWQTGALMIVTALIGLAGGIGCTYFSSKAALGFGADLRMNLYEKVQSFSFLQLDRFQAGSLITRLTGDVIQLQNLLQLLLRSFVREVSLLIGSAALVILISPRLSLVLIVVIPVILIVLLTLVRRSIPLFGSMQRKLDSLNTVLQENISGIRVVKAFVRGAFEQKRFGTANTDYLETGLKATRTIAVNMPLMMLIMNVSIVAVLWYGGAEAWEGALPIGDLAAFLTYMAQVLFSLISLSNTISNISRAKASADRINEILETVPDMADAGAGTERCHEAMLKAPSRGGTAAYDLAAKEHAPDAVSAAASAVVRTGSDALAPEREGQAPTAPSGQVVFENVSFAYDPDKPELVLRNISFSAQPGQTIGILGATGSGKSTLVSLIPRLYDATEGQVLIDGQDVRSIPLDELRRKVGMVLQQSFLFSGKIRDNIRYGRPAATEEDIIAAAKAAEAHEFISKLPDGYDTELGQRGVNLSGGQKQRLSIARAILMRPDVLVLDDSTSAIDLGTEKRIQRSLQALMKGSTRFIIAQRISSVKQADLIVVLDQGRIAAAGTHDELIQHSPVYQEIYKSQQGKEAALHA